MTPKLKKRLIRVIVAAVLFSGLFAISKTGWLLGFPKEWILAGLFMAVYLMIGYDVLVRAAKNIAHGQIFDENFLMVIATFAAFAIGEYEEALAVMVFYQLGEWFQDYAVGRSRNSVKELMAIAPEYVNLYRDGAYTEEDPEEALVGDVFLVKPGERVPLDGRIKKGESMIDTSSITGESVPVRVSAGDSIVSGCVNLKGALVVEATKRYEDSTVSRILELVENASGRKAKTEHFITRFAKYYTPAVTIAAILVALIPPLFFGGAFPEWIRRACTFLVISCPCAVVISVPLGFFGGIGASSRLGVLVKGSNYLEMLAKVKTVAFDKTGTVTAGTFTVTEIRPAAGVSEESLLTLAAAAERYSTHPIAESIRKEAGPERMLPDSASYEEIAGQGVKAMIDGRFVYVGNAKLMAGIGAAVSEHVSGGTVVYVAEENRYLGALTISDTVKKNAREALNELKENGVSRTVMLTGDRRAEAERVAKALSIDEVRAELMPGDKVEAIEALIRENPKGAYTAFVGDGLNDAPVLMRADLGLAMGSLGSDAAIEAADIVLMDDDLGKIADTVRIARKTLRIVREDIVIALTVKFVVLCLGALGIASMWLAIFADVGVAVLAILNSMRTLRIGKKKPKT